MGREAGFVSHRSMLLPSEGVSLRAVGLSLVLPKMSHSSSGFLLNMLGPGKSSSIGSHVFFPPGVASQGPGYEEVEGLRDVGQIGCSVTTTGS